MHKRFWQVGRVLAIVVLCGFLLWYGSRDRLNLLDRSTRITSVRGWGMERPDLNIAAHFYEMMGGGAQYAWIGNRQILFFHGLTPIQASRSGTNGRGGWNLNWPRSVGTPTLYDVPTHSERPLPKLATLFRHTGGLASSATVSPDGSSLLWEDNQYAHFHVASLNGSHHMSVDSYQETIGQWYADNRRFYSYGWSEDAHKNNILVGQPWDAITGDALHDRSFTPPTSYDMLGNCALTPKGDLVTNTLHLPNVKLTLFRISPTPASVVTAVSVERLSAVPSKVSVSALVYSPQGDKIAWVLEREESSPFAFLQRWLPNQLLSTQHSASLWLSGTLGENLHEIGHIYSHNGGRQYYLIDYVRWQPDGKTLSFISDDALYTVPAN